MRFPDRMSKGSSFIDSVVVWSSSRVETPLIGVCRPMGGTWRDLSAWSALKSRKRETFSKSDVSPLTRPKCRTRRARPR